MPVSNEGPRGSSPLALSDSERKSLAGSAVELLERLQARRADATIFTPTPDALIQSLLAPPREEGHSVADVLQRLEAAASCGWMKAHPGDLSYIPTGGLYSGVIAALLASGLNAFTGGAHEAPALIAIEESVLRWLSQALGLPANSEGVLLSGGSLCNQTAVVCARASGFRVDRSRVYLCCNAHHSLRKALAMAGIPDQCVCAIGADSRQRLDVRSLSTQIERDVADGLAPWLIIGTAGTTDIGAIDDLEALSEVARTHGAWLHVDAAYGGMFALTERGARLFKGLENVDSVTVDGHKGLMLPYGVAALLVRHPGRLAEAHSGTGTYMRDVGRVQALPHYFERGPELTRPFRGLLVWLPLQLHGIGPFRDALDRCLDLAQVSMRKLEEVPGVEVYARPQLSIVAFRGADEAHTEALLAAINASGKVHVTSTTLSGATYIRLAFLNPTTGEREIDAVIEAVRGTTRPRDPGPRGQ